MTMNIFVNRAKTSTSEKTSVELLLMNLGIEKKFIAVEVNQVIVPKSKYKNFYLKENDKIEIIKAIGVKLCCITPSRGFAIELGSATIIIIGSRLGIPLSTTHCQVGATMGVAALEDMKKCSGINWKIACKVFAGWILTLLIVGGTTALLAMQGLYAPSK